MHIGATGITRVRTIRRHLCQCPPLTRWLLSDLSLNPQLVSSQLTSWVLHTWPICAFSLPVANAKEIFCFPTTARILFSGIQIAIHGKHVGSLQFFISCYRQCLIGLWGKWPQQRRENHNQRKREIRGKKKERQLSFLGFRMLNIYKKGIPSG